jgi:hypothetical protein
MNCLLWFILTIAITHTVDLHIVELWNNLLMSNELKKVFVTKFDVIGRRLPRGIEERNEKSQCGKAISRQKF